MIGYNCLTPPLSPTDRVEGEDVEEQEAVVNGIALMLYLTDFIKAISMELEIPVTSFQCLGEVKIGTEHFHGNSYLNSNYLEKLSVNVETRHAPFQSQVEVFDHCWPAKLSKINIELLFLLMRQKIAYLQRQVSLSTRPPNTESDRAKVRGHINKFLEVVLQHVRDDNVRDDELAAALLKEIHHVINHIGRISEIKELAFHTALLQGSISFCYFHLHLDVYWKLLCILHILQTRYPDCDSVYGGQLCEVVNNDLKYGMFDQVLHIILWDLVTIGQSRYLTFVQGQEYRMVSLFPCTCVQEFWQLCIKLSQLRTSKVNGEFFWLSLHHIIKTVCDWEMRDKEIILERYDCSVMTNPPESFNVDDATSTCMWILSNVTPLYRDDKLSEANKFVSNYHDLQTILKKFLSSHHVSEKSLKKHLHTCLYITSHWEPNTRLLSDLWDYFYRKLDKTFQSNTSSVDGLACVEKTIAGFYSQCKKWTCGFEDRDARETSFQLFLSILSQHLGKGNKAQEWRQFKGRIYSKFYPRRIQELSDVGLYNLTCLFLTLAMTVNTEELASKLCDFYDMLNFETITFGKRSVIWCGAFTMMLVYEERDMDVDFLADRMSKTLEHCVREYRDSDVSTKHNLWNLIHTYLEGTQEVIENSKNLCGSEYKLIGPGISTLLTTCSENQLRHTLTVIQSIFNRFRQVINQKGMEKNGISVTSRQHLELSKRLWEHIYKFVVEHAEILTPPVEIADVAAEFCLLALQMPQSQQTFLSVFQTFASGEKVNANVSCRFLSQLLGSQDVRAKLQLDLKSWEPYVIRCWFHCCVLVPVSSKTLQEVTRCALQLHEVRQAFMQASMDPPDDHSDTPVQFLKALYKAHGKLETWPEKMEFQKMVMLYFIDLHKSVVPALRNVGATNILSNIYLIVGNMIKYCAKLIYFRQDVIVPSLISSMILPQHVVDKDKPVTQGFLSLVKEYLHLATGCYLNVTTVNRVISIEKGLSPITLTLPEDKTPEVFIQGLGRLPYERDLFVQRRLKDIIVTYLPKFSVRPSSISLTVSTATSVHPIVASLRGTFIHQPSQESVKFRHYVMKVVIENFVLVKNMTVHPQHAMGWSFLGEVVQKTLSSIVLARDFPELLLVCLEYLHLLPEQSSVLQNILSVLRETARAHRENEDVIQLSVISSSCQKFIQGYFRHSLKEVLKVMEQLAELHKPAVTSVIPDLSASVKEIEKKRGVGVDQMIRKKYCNILQSLGDQGKEELIKLQSTS